MASSIMCGPCGYEDNIKNAEKWCTDCEDGYCEDCEKVHRSTKMSRNHQLISIEDYQKIKDVSVKQNCEDHGKKFDLYCITHDRALCIACVNQHKSCADVTPLDEAARNAKESTAFADLEDTINGALGNIGKCIEDQESTEKHVENQKQMITKKIKEIREKINKQLNVLEMKLINVLSEKSSKCKSSLEKTLNQLNSADKKLIQLKEETQKMKKFASDVQVFLGTREMNRYVANEIQSVKRTINSAQNFNIVAEFDLDISSLLNHANEMGKISLIEVPTGLQFKDAKIDQAQKRVLAPGKTLHNLRLQLKHKFKIRGTKEDETYITGSIILPNGHLLIANGKGSTHIMEYNEEGNHIRDIPISERAYDLTMIDLNRIAITYASVAYHPVCRPEKKFDYQNLNFLEIINITSGLSIRKIQAANSCWGVSHQNGRLYVIVKQEGILVADVLGNIIKTLRINTYNVEYISTSQDMIYYSDCGKNTVHCCNMDGKEIWVCRPKSVSLPAGVSVGDNKEIFVVGCASNNISVIHSDGTESKTLLTAADGLSEPQAIHYDKHRKTLLVCNKTSFHAALYTVV